jgi:2Fe-2S ferredoxin
LPEITYVQPDGTARVVDAEPGSSVMQAAIGNDIDGIVAECGGNAMCATCHVYVDAAMLGALPEMGPDEDEMLDCTMSPREAGSRLSCQLRVTEELDGLLLRLPPEQS